MAEHPLLIFPGKAEVSRSKKSGGPSSYHYPSHGRQGARLSPKFTQLQTALQQKNIEAQQTAVGIEPEQALVFETIGSVENFVNAVKRIEGFEWLGEIEIDSVAPDDDFYVLGAEEKPLGGRLYIVMTNTRALDELLSLWNKWQSDPSVTFDFGLNKFKEIFKQLKDIRRWDVQDRLLETGVLEAWQEDLQHDGQRRIRFEIELWYRNTPEKQMESEQQIESLITQLNGEIREKCIISEIAYHSILAELSAQAIQSIIADHNTELVRCDNVMFFRPVGQISGGYDIEDEQAVTLSPEERPLPSGAPVVALLDGLPVSNHAFLANRLIIDDPDGWSSDYSMNELRHGTALASLIIHGDLADNTLPLPTPVYVRPIMKPDPKDFHSPRTESVPETSIAVDLIYRAVKRIVEGEGKEPPSAPSVKIVNLSICDPHRHFNYMMSPWARLLDWLSVKYNILFIVSAGNHCSAIDIKLNDGEDLLTLDNSTRQQKIVQALYSDSRNRRILSPAESINSLTVGAAHVDGVRVFQNKGAFNPFETILPSPISPFGNGYRKSIKPDLIYHGGRQLYRQSISDQARGEPVMALAAPGNIVAYPSTQAGVLNNTIHCRGTSNAAALLSRAAAICHDSLLEILQGNALDINYDPYFTAILKAMLVHGCSWNEIGQTMEEILQDGTLTEGQLQKAISKWLGYGFPDINKVLDCTEQRASIIGFGSLSNDEAHVFDLPLPPSLELKGEWRKLSVTLAWLSPIVPTNQKYRQASLWFETENNNIARSRTDSQWQAVRRGTVQHEVFEGLDAVAFSNDGVMQIKVNCTKDAGKIETPISYGLIVSLEVMEGIDIPIYEEIRSRIAPRVQISQATET